MWLMVRSGAQRSDWLNLGLWYALFWAPAYLANRNLYIITHGVLLPVGLVTPQAVPLRVCTLERGRWHWRLRWADPPLRPTVNLPNNPHLIRLVRDAMAACPPDAPATRKEAGRVVSVAVLPTGQGRYFWVFVAAAVTGIGVGVWLNQPLFLLPLVGIPALALVGRMRRLVLTPDALFIVSTDAEPVRIDRSAVTDVVVDARSRTYIHTAHPDFRVIDLHSLHVTQIAGRLRYGDAEPSAGAPHPHAGKAPAAAPQTAPARCALCGKPLPGATTPGDVPVCDQCAARTRHEAAQGGHGPTGRDPKPM